MVPLWVKWPLDDERGEVLKPPSSLGPYGWATPPEFPCNSSCFRKFFINGRPSDALVKACPLQQIVSGQRRMVL